jgi:hypothetical protein
MWCRREVPYPEIVSFYDPKFVYVNSVINMVLVLQVDMNYEYIRKFEYFCELGYLFNNMSKKLFEP